MHQYRNILPETARKEYLIATYFCKFRAEDDPYRKAEAFASGQTVGTWTQLSSVTEQMQRDHAGMVAGVTCLPPYGLSTQIEEPYQYTLIDIAFPVANFGTDFAMLITTLLGNDASTSTQAKLVDIQLPASYLRAFHGPKFGVSGIRKLTNVQDRPLLLSMIKPCVGLSPEAAADIFFETALGGADIVKDDELMGNAAYSPLITRVALFEKKARQVFEATGRTPVYAVNLSGRPREMLENLRRAVDAGAKMVMVNYAAVGYGCAQDICAESPVPVLGHYAGTGVYFESPESGMSAHLAMGRLPRLSGIDLAVICTPYGGYPLRGIDYFKTVHHLTLPLDGIEPTMPVIGGKVSPGIVRRYVDELGIDIVLGAGGAIHGHPGGAAAGARAMRAAIDAAVSNQSIQSAAENCEDLAVALALWK